MSLKGERARKKKLVRVTITIERSNLHSVSYLVHTVDIYGYYEWLDIREALKSVRSTYRKVVEDELDKFILKISQHTKLLPLIKKVADKPHPQKKRPSGRWTPRYIRHPPTRSFDLLRADTSMLNLELPGNISLSHGSIIQEPKFGIFLPISSNFSASKNS